MKTFKVSYRSMTAIYGPCIAEAEDEFDAKMKLAHSMGYRGEKKIHALVCLHAQEVTLEDIQSMKEKRTE